jgi:uncharacterized protein (DUF1330 family)/uncharacterized protein with GYD domain
MALYLYESAYSAESIATLIKSPQDRLEAVRPAFEAAGGRIVAGGYAFGEYDIVVIYEAPDDTTAASLALVVAGSGAARSAKNDQTAQRGRVGRRAQGGAIVRVSACALSPWIQSVSKRECEQYMAKGYWVATYRSISNPDGMAAYAALAGPAIQAGGGKFLARGNPSKAYESGLMQRVVVIEFDSVDQAIAAHDSEAYQAALKALGNSADRDIRIVEGAG